jgi:hypothetical protein
MRNAIMRGGWEEKQREVWINMREDRWRNLEVWKLSDGLAYEIYLATRVAWILG